MSVVGRRYAEALLANLDGADPGKALEDLEAFGSWLNQIPELKVAVENPGIPLEAKDKIVSALGAAGGLEAKSIRFIRLVVANRRIRQWDDILEAFRALCDERRGIVRARVNTARTLDESAKRDLAVSLGKILGRRVELESGVSPGLLGGVELRLGSTVYDGTVAGALKALHQDLVKG
jgi:F-type H+-transporting ATPase subunit delta